MLTRAVRACARAATVGCQVNAVVQEVSVASVQEFFDGLGARDSSKTEGMNNSYVFDIDGAGTWTVRVADGTIAVAEGAEDGVDATITASEESFQMIVAGELNPTTAYMTGKLKLKGDMGAAMKLQKIFG
jgi:alkyl sulfatase BDS1-like metallo-beta-lactamase superfamily hydrolase